MQAFGSNSHGQLGIGSLNDTATPENCVFGEKSIIPKSVACGANHSLVISSEDELWVSGSNSHGQIGLDVEQVSSFVRLNSDLLVKLEAVAAGWNHSLVLLRNGQLYALGSNDNGQCGLSNVVNLRQPVLIEGLPKLSAVICSLYASYGLDFEVIFGIKIKGKIWGWGMNRHGELAISFPTMLFTPKCIVDTHSVIEIACGQYHLIFLTENKKIYGMGSNKYGQLGNPVEKLSKTSRPVLIFDEIVDVPIQIVSGWNFSGCLLDNGNVYLWGRCDMGQLAYDPESIQDPLLKSVKNSKMCDSPYLNCHLKRIKRIASGSESCLALDMDKNLFSFGWNEHGNCGCGHNLNVYLPAAIGQAEFIAAGYGYSIIYKNKK
jgi:secretion-regulating guanine nucleotide exchange factor